MCWWSGMFGKGCLFQSELGKALASEPGIRLTLGPKVHLLIKYVLLNLKWTLANFDLLSITCLDLSRPHLYANYVHRFVCICSAYLIFAFAQTWTCSYAFMAWFVGCAVCHWKVRLEDWREAYYSRQALHCQDLPDLQTSWRASASLRIIIFVRMHTHR